MTDTSLSPQIRILPGGDQRLLAGIGVIDPTSLDEVLWAMCTRCDPAEDIDFIQRAWSGPLDPIIQPGQKGHNSRMIIEAVRPWEWRDKFPATSAISDETRTEFSKKWQTRLAQVQARHAQGHFKSD